jgi:hypothetical protein
MACMCGLPYEQREHPPGYDTCSDAQLELDDLQIYLQVPRCDIDQRTRAHKVLLLASSLACRANSFERDRLRVGLSKSILLVIAIVTQDHLLTRPRPRPVVRCPERHLTFEIDALSAALTNVNLFTIVEA